MVQRIHKLYANNVRVLKNFLCSFSDNITQIVGENGQGKTSILESLYLLMTGSSFRTSRLQEVISHNETLLHVEAVIEKEGHQSEVKLFIENGKRKLFYNKRECPSSALIGLIHGVVTTQDDVDIVRGAPAVRRKFLDLQNGQADPLYVHHLTRYQRALKQRNVLLKNQSVQHLGVWEKELAASGAYLILERRKTMGLLNQSICCFYNQFSLESVSSMIEIRDLSHYPIGIAYEELISLLEHEYIKRRYQELAFGATLVGPHRNDFEVLLDGKRCKEFGSEGQARLVVIAIKFAEWDLLKARIADTPIFLADDLSAHLDPKRFSKVVEALSTLGQVILTGQSESLSAHKNTLYIHNGGISLANAL